MPDERVSDMQKAAQHVMAQYPGYVKGLCGDNKDRRHDLEMLLEFAAYRGWRVGFGEATEIAREGFVDPTPTRTMTPVKETWHIVGKDGKDIANGEVFELDEGEKVRYAGFRPPKHQGSTGRVTLQFEDGSTQDYYPSVIDAKIIKRTQT